MNGLNTVALGGNLVRDAELRATQGGMAVLSFTVAVNESRKNRQTGEWEDYPNFIDCIMFGRRAEVLSGRMAKGSYVALTGSLRWSSWEKDGQKRSKVEVVAGEIHIESKGGAAPELYDDDCPF